MAFTASDVKNLREMTGVGMMDCKKALTEADGDINKAIEYLREKGLATAQKKAGRIAAEGVCRAFVGDAGEAAVVEVNIETDFAAKNEDFQKFASDIAEVVAKNNPADIDALMAMPYPGSKMTVNEMQQEKVLVIGENIKVRRFARYDTGISVSYIHMGGRIGVLVNMDVSEQIRNKPEVTELGKDLAMQIAAMRPQYLDKTSVSEEEIEKEREIQLAKAMEDNREKNLPEEKALQVAESMVKGRMNKFFEEMCLMQQAFVKENKISVEKHVAGVAKELGGTIKIVSFTRFETGEGIEKKVDNFADEVASMIK
jgi:elongation factor Ts